MRYGLLLTAASAYLAATAAYPYGLVGVLGCILIGIPTVGALMVRLGLSDLIDGKPAEGGGTHDRY